VNTIYVQAKKDDKTSRAIALGYEPEKDDAPRVLATGKGIIANQIIEIAKKNGIPIKDDPVLAAVLSEIDVNNTIPPELYRVVAEVLSYIYRIQQKHTR
jgi:flagellar biosynthesis protein